MSNKISLNTEIEMFKSSDDLNEEVQNLIKIAHKVRLNAYATYSNFLVGAALLLDNGEIISGNNQENAAYPSGLCAERTAVFYANSKFPKQKILIMAIVAGSKFKPSKSPVSPCGACRQALVEYEKLQNSPIELYFMGIEGEIAYSKSVENILPWSFDNKLL
tara:strand:- start:433 stop:918 length:486 start_codon:yes stop_codon:yes gene_type:complete